MVSPAGMILWTGFFQRALIWAGAKKAIKKFKADNPKILIDIATGTADMAILASRILNVEKIEGIDISEQMLEAGKKENWKRRT